MDALPPCNWLEECGFTGIDSNAAFLAHTGADVRESNSSPRHDSSEEEESDGGYGDWAKALRRKRQRLVGSHVVETKLRAETECRQKSSPQGPKKNRLCEQGGEIMHARMTTRQTKRRKKRKLRRPGAGAK